MSMLIEDVVGQAVPETTYIPDRQHEWDVYHIPFFLACMMEQEISEFRREFGCSHPPVLERKTATTAVPRPVDVVTWGCSCQASQLT